MRERATLQSFPISFQFYSPFYREKIRLIGNAMPPLVAFYLGQAFRQVALRKLENPANAIGRYSAPSNRAPVTKPVLPGTKLLDRRRFKFAIPSLHLKSGVRFEFAEQEAPVWRIQFFYGTSKVIRTITLGDALLAAATKRLSRPMRSKINAELRRLRTLLSTTDSVALQKAWAKTGNGVVGPLQLLDQLSSSGEILVGVVGKDRDLARRTVVDALNGHGPDSDDPVGVAKLLINAPMVAAGILVGSLTNSVLRQRDEDKSAKLDRS
jgi:DNA (cytosine-5)-methyltransferase 1